MKKLLVLALVLGMASMASAVMQISVGTNHDPQDSTIVLNESDTISIGIWTDTGLPTNTSYDTGMCVLVTDGTLTGGVAVPHTDCTTGIFYTLQDAGINGLPDGVNGGLFSYYTFSTPVASGENLFQGITFHCEKGSGDTIIAIGEVDQDGNWTGNIYDTLTIHQIPEPATIALLGLGGLLLRRRK